MTQQEFDDCKELLFDKLMEWVKVFEAELSLKFSSSTVNKYVLVASSFAHYIQDYTSHLRFEDISVANANSKFIAQAKWEGLYGWNNQEIKHKLNAFILFLDANGLHNHMVLNAMSKK